MSIGQGTTTPHSGHELRGPHAPSRLTAEQCHRIQQWLDQSDQDAVESVRDVAQFIRSFPPLERAVLGMAGSALLGGLQLSNTTHAIAMLGVRRTRWLIRAVLEATSHATASAATADSRRD
ncbi:MAG: hypothetical protein KF861_03115 [Planctomycetaceae bacterium]|nr:hypothetical protein [Planctomycetaceae bacterium]